MHIRLARATRWGACLLFGYTCLCWTLTVGLFKRGFPPPPTTQWPVIAFIYKYDPVRMVNRHFLNQPFHNYPYPFECGLVLCGLFLCYFWILRAARIHRGTMTLRSILIWTAVFCLPLIIAPPDSLSPDVYAYIMQARVGAVHHMNPMLVPPSAFPSDQFLKYVVTWQDAPANYGPVWNSFSVALTYLLSLLGDAPLLYLIAYKLVAAGFHLATATLIWRLLGEWKPEQQVWGTLLYAWNPLAVMEFAGSAHNDAALVFCLLLTLRAAYRTHWRRATASLTLGILIKYVPALLLPLYAVMLFRLRTTWSARLKVAGQMAAIVLLLGVLFFAPFWQGSRNIKMLLGAPTMNASMNSIAALAMDVWPATAKALRLDRNLQTPGAAVDLADQMISSQRQTVNQIVLWIGRAILLATWIGMLYALWRRPSFGQFVSASFWVLLCYTLFGTMWFWPWYMTWALALAALLDWRPAGRIAVLLTATAAAVHIELHAGWLWLAGAAILALVLVDQWNMMFLRVRQRSSG